MTDATVVPNRLIETKLRAPRRRGDALQRARLTERLLEAQPALTVVSAPAGFGKTTLLTEWMAQGRCPTAWLSLDAGDSELVRFWSYVIASLRVVMPDVGEDAAAALRADPSGAESAIASLVNDLDTSASQVALVLDDYHVIESPDVHASLVFFLEHLPPQVHLVVAGRADPPLPLARLRARGQLLEIRAADLRFTIEETSSYFREAMAFDLTDRDVAALEARTEGWIAALQLAALSLRGRADVSGFIESFTGDDRFVVDYLIEEVLERQAPEVHRFLLQTSVLAGLNAALCDAVTGQVGSGAMLEMLDRTNLFVVPLDDHRRWYRYHHLFGDVLRARLLGEDPGVVPELHRRASEWYERNGELPDAVAHAMAAGDDASAARLIELATPAMRQSRQEATLRRWLEALPDDLFGNRPVLSVVLAGARMGTGDPTGVEELLQRAEPWLHVEPGRDAPIVVDDEQFARLPAEITMYRAGLALLEGDLPSTIAHASRIAELAEPTDHVRLGAASALSGLAHWATGALIRGGQLYSDAVEHFVAADFIPDVLGCSLALADIQLAQGRLGDAGRTFDRALHLARGRPGLRGTADMHIGLSELALERNDLDAAGAHQRRAREHGDRAGLPQNAYRWRVAVARLLHAQGDSAGAQRLLDEAIDLYDTDFSPAVRPVRAVLARLHVSDGDLQAASAWAESREISLDDEVDYLHEYEHLTLARLRLAQLRAGDGTVEDLGEDLVGLLERTAAAAEEGHRDGAVAEALALLALVHDTRGDHALATEMLDRALLRAAPAGYVRLFLDEGPAMTALLHAPELSPAAAAHARRVLGTVRHGVPAPTRSGLIDDLSGRELDVLRLLRSDLSGPEIARELLVSLNTLRTHTKNIYAKLGVNSRREAITRAGQLGL
ncbi:MAG: LuxR C-terminal-related transcriptional regulator [Acidimicrobiia bacterium]